MECISSYNAVSIIYWTIICVLILSSYYNIYKSILNESRIVYKHLVKVIAKDSKQYYNITWLMQRPQQLVPPSAPAI